MTRKKSPRRRLLSLGAFASLLLGAFAAWRCTMPGPTIAAPDPDTAPTDPLAETSWRSRLTEARRACRPEPIEQLLVELRRAAEEAPDDAPKGRTAGELWDLVAAAELELLLTLCVRIPWRVGEPMYPEVPPEVLAASERGIAALARARELGVETADGYRAETAMLSHRITGMVSALKYQPGVNEAFAKAQEIDPENPRLHVGLGCRKMFVPAFMGQDVPAALQHFRYAIQRLPRDERPSLYAAMALNLLDRREEALAMAESALELNPANPMAAVVVERLRAGEEDPFGRPLPAADGVAGDRPATAGDRR